jgi:hypothetical protein
MIKWFDVLKVGVAFVAVAITAFYTYQYGTLVAFNIWAAGGPPTPNPEVYLAQAQAFQKTAGAWLVAFIVSLLILVRLVWRLLFTVT